MPTRRLPDKDNKHNKKLCMHPDHNPPLHMVFQPGDYEHTCPSCGGKIIFTVPTIIYGSSL